MSAEVVGRIIVRVPGLQPQLGHGRFSPAPQQSRFPCVWEPSTFAGGVIVEPSRSFLGPGEVAAVCGLLLYSQRLFSLFSLSFSSLGASFFGCFQPGWFFQMPLPSFCFVGAPYVAWVFFTRVYFLLELFFLKALLPTSSFYFYPQQWFLYHTGLC
jgi:hypothetical protein